MSVASFHLLVPRVLAEKYDEFLSPSLFLPLAKETVERLTPTLGSQPVKVLELAAGTGCLTKELQAVLPSGSTITATDINEEMLAVAQSTAASSGGVNENVKVTYAPANMGDLTTYADRSFDIVVAQIGFNCVADYTKAFAEARRVLVPGGRLIFSVWGPEEKSSMFAVAYQVVGVYAKGKDEATKARIEAMNKVPNRLSDATAVASHLATAGFSASTVTKVPIMVTDTATLARGMVTGTPYTMLVPSEEQETCVAQIHKLLGTTFAAEAHVHEATA